jgi:phospholipase A1
MNYSVYHVVRNTIFTFSLFISLLIFPIGNLFAQSNEIVEFFRNQMDTTKLDFRKPKYLLIDETNLLDFYKRQPSFGMYKDNYFITGVPINEKITKHTADVKFQISVRQYLFKNLLPSNSTLLLTYTQKSFWNLYEESAPFQDNNYNPGLVLIKPIIIKNRLYGAINIALEHESNGEDGLKSRGWNYLMLSGIYFYNPCFSVQAKVWNGILSKADEEHGEVGNPDLFKYRGYGMFVLNYRSLNDKFGASLVINPCAKNVNSQLEVSYKPNKRNQYIFLQWYQGYCENMLEYNLYFSMLRVGICIKPPIRDFF